MALKQNLVKDSRSVCLQHLINQTTLLPPFIQIWDNIFFRHLLRTDAMFLELSFRLLLDGQLITGPVGHF